MEPDLDSDLVKQIQTNGGMETFELLVSQYIPFVRGLMYKMGINASDADDLTQDVFIKVYRNLPKFRGSARFKTWIYRIAVNTAKSYFRKELPISLRKADIPPENVASPGSRPDTAILNAEVDQAITEALRSLPVKFRTAIVLTLIEGKDYHEAARIEGCPRATIYWRVHKARQLLKRELKEYL